MNFMLKRCVAVVVAWLVFAIGSVAFAGQASTVDNFAYVLNTAFDNPSELIDNNLTEFGRQRGVDFYRGNYKNVDVLLGVNGDGTLVCASLTVPDYTNFNGIYPLCHDRFGEPQVKIGPSNIASIVMDYEWKSQSTYMTLVSEKPSRYGWRDQVSFQLNPGYFN